MQKLSGSRKTSSLEILCSIFDILFCRMHGTNLFQILAKRLRYSFMAPDEFIILELLTAEELAIQLLPVFLAGLDEGAVFHDNGK
jgi:hypothetical protein